MRWIPALSSLVVGMVLGSGFVQADTLPPDPARLNGAPIFVVADGSGASTALTQGLLQAMRRTGMAAPLVRVPWCRYGAAAQDHVDREAQDQAACRTAELVALLRDKCPQSPIFLLGHSTGTRVVVEAAKRLPKGSVERIVLLASSLSSHHDTRGAAAAARRGIDSFFSDRDWVLQVAADYLGPSDGLPGQCAGFAGFCPDPTHSGLRQHRWVEGLGGHGGHLSWTQEHFVGNVLLPLLLGGRSVD